MGGEGYVGVVWDAFFLYGPGADWKDEPGPLLASGAPLVGRTGPIALELKEPLTQ